MDIADNDILIHNTNKFIEHTNKSIVNKVKELRRSKNENQFLNMVYTDYLKHYDYMLNEKYKTRAALLNIFQHLENIEKTNDFTNDQLMQTKKEQNNILNKLYHIKSEIDDITNLN